MTESRGKGRPKLTLTPEQVELVEKYAGIGCTNSQIAYLLGISESTFERRAKEDQGIFDALHKGRALAASEVMQTAYRMATSGAHPYMTAFWLKCRLRWSEPKEEPTQQEDLTIQLNYKK